MSIDRSDIEKLGELARIHISDENALASAKSINEVLALVDQLQAVDTANIEPLANPLGARQRLRRDEVSEGNQRDAFQAVAPATEDGLYLVPKVIE
ncbi:asparaginyl/glutamyl-tRNA amidotransferase subunit C [Gammaproteobacteria bacterium 53_120_T64]|nr:asparaginyl/glutamyl-tRNA amidotransferase subunit C [Gammaproteobacteria bacterium 53_120_T64]